ncbi:hypothetical protein [Paenibacillus sp. FSL H8-0034]|uniref:hypothetical protein n=1 Tax=Paenibacillus sp. FSL H8-0034 TaxID=2954671 RepID=UPI0030F4F36A
MKSRNTIKQGDVIASLFNDIPQNDIQAVHDRTPINTSNDLQHAAAGGAGGTDVGGTGGGDNQSSGREPSINIT